MKVIKDNVFIFLSLLVILTYGIIEYFYHGKFVIFGNIVGWLIALLIAINYLQKNRRDNQIAKKEEFKKSLEIDAFREINKSLSAFSHAISDISGYFRYLYSINLFLYRINPTIAKFNKMEIILEIRKKHENLIQGLTRFLITIESNEIVVIQFDHLRKYIQFQIDDVNEKIDNFEQYLNKTEREKLISEEGYSEFKENCDEIIEYFTNIQSYLFDYRILLMNSLLGDTFDTKVPMRKPRDPKYKLLTEVATKEEVEKEAKIRENRYSS
jgi:tetrahydromethanopterin S-methyltransferase subunit B